WRMRIESREADRGSAERGRREIKTVKGRDEIVALLRLWKNEWHIMALVAPSVHVHWRVENAVGRVDHDAITGKILGDPDPGGEVIPPRIQQPLGIALLAADKNGRRSVLENQVGVRIFEVAQGAHIFVTKPDHDGRRAGQLKGVLGETVGVPLTELHL